MNRNIRYLVIGALAVAAAVFGYLPRASENVSAL
jgi:hypothetical protein